MRPGEPIYALGHFETWSNVPGTTERSRKQVEILAEWKEDPSELVRRFDEDGDGRVDGNDLSLLAVRFGQNIASCR